MLGGWEALRGWRHVGRDVLVAEKGIHGVGKRQQEGCCRRFGKQRTHGRWEAARGGRCMGRDSLVAAKMSS